MLRLLAICLLTTSLGVARQAAAEELSARLELKLEDALVRNDLRDEHKSRSLDVYAECHAGRWQDVWGDARDFNRALHLGRVISADVAEKKLVLSVEMTIAADHWVGGGQAKYQITLARNGQTLSGDFKGAFETATGTNEVSGKVTGRLLPLPSIADGFEPVQPGEHPRLLFRKSQLAALREKAKTPLGQAIVELLKGVNDPVAMGVLYQLTGDRSYAERAQPLTVQTMNDRNGGAFALGRFWGYRTSVVAASYDLCYDAWSPEFRQQVEDYCDWILFKCLHRQHRVGTVNWQPGSNYTVVIHAGNGMAALALSGEKGPAPVEPLPPRKQPPHIAPPADLSAKNGSPVSILTPNQCLTDWLTIGPFPQHTLQHEHPYYDYRQPVDCLASIGGMEKARPAPGDEVVFKKQTLKWKPLTIAANPDVMQRDPQRAGKLAIRCTKLDGDRENTHLFFYTLLENEQPGWYRFDGPFYEGKCFLGGERILHGESFYLEKGRFPLLLPAAIADGEYSVYVEFVPTTEQEAKQFYDDPARQQAYQRAQKNYTERLARWKNSGEANVDWLEHADALRHYNFLCLRQGMGEGGFQGEGEGYTLECHHVIHDYACCFQNVFGRAVTGDNDIGYFAPRYIATGVWTPRDGREQFVSQSFGGHGGGTIAPHYLARSIALCPKEWQGAVLGHWLKQLGVGADAIKTEAGARQALSNREFHDGLTLAEALVNFPLDVKPTGPDGVLPRVWEAKTRGFYAFRSGWDSQSIVAQIYARAGDDCGWSQAEAGCFQLYGLGHSWAAKDNNAAGKTGSRWLDNVVMLPDDPIDAWGHGKVVDFVADPKTGAGTVTFDLADVYRSIRQIGQGKGSRRETFDGGIAGVRSFAADYSGKCGAPALLAIGDKITGGGKKVWMWQVPHSDRDEPACKVTVGEHDFTLSYADANLKATFVSPAAVKIQHVHGKQPGLSLSNISEADVDAIHVSGADPKDGQFLVVVTLQKGAAPEVQADKGEARVGSQRVSFDGRKIEIR